MMKSAGTLTLVIFLVSGCTTGGPEPDLIIQAAGTRLFAAGDG